MARLLVVGGGYFGSLAAAWARYRGLEALVFDAGLPGAASPAAAGLFQEAWIRPAFRPYLLAAMSLLDRLYGLNSVQLTLPDGRHERFHFVPPRLILEHKPLRQRVTAVGDGWIEADGCRYSGSVYVAVGAWSTDFLPSLKLTAKAGAAFLFPGERPGRIQSIGRGRQAIAFSRDPGTTYFADGTAEVDYTPDHRLRSLTLAADFDLSEPPQRELWGRRPYTPGGGPYFTRLGQRTWLATGGRKLGMIFGAALAQRLIDDELRGRQHMPGR